MTHYAIFAAVIACSITVPVSARADDLLDRYKIASELQALNMADFMVSRVPELADVIPAPEWIDESNTVGGCVLEQIRTDRGDDGVEAYVAAVEEMAAVEITSLSALGENSPELLSDMYFMDVAQGCGAMELAQKQMQDSGLLSMMAEPGVMDRLAAD